MIRGTVTFELGTDSYVAILRDEGWSVAALAQMADVLNDDFGLDRYGPADGDPFASAVHDAAEFLAGVPELLNPSPPGPPDRIY